MSIISHSRTSAHIAGQSAALRTDVNAVWRRATRWAAATAKRLYPVVVLFGFFAIAIAATIAIRLAIWLPMFLHSRG
ncbi:MAG TPA: hypothetical protein VGF02_00635 [Pseudolabrys sp.]|jgi:hypothetical protein